MANDRTELGGQLETEITFDALSFAPVLQFIRSLDREINVPLGWVVRNAMQQNLAQAVAPDAKLAALRRGRGLTLLLVHVLVGPDDKAQQVDAREGTFAR
eukprot:5397826-Prymnesium_polylepis.1